MNPASSLVRIAKNAAALSKPIFGVSDFDPTVQVHVSHSNHGANIALPGWGQLLLTTARFGNATTLEILSVVQSLRDQIDVVESALSTTSLDHDMYISALDSLRDALSLGRLYCPWDATRALFTPHVISILKICEHALGDQESKSPTADISELLDCLDSLELHCQNPELDSDVRLFLIEMVTVTKRALLEYEILGLKAIVRARQLILASMECADEKLPSKLDDESKGVAQLMLSKLSKLIESTKPHAELVAQLLGLMANNSS